MPRGEPSPGTEPPSGTAGPHAHVIPVAPELPEGLDEEPGALVAGGIQGHPHGVFFQQRRQPLVHRQVLVALHVQQLEEPRVGQLKIPASRGSPDPTSPFPDVLDPCWIRVPPVPG